MRFIKLFFILFILSLSACSHVYSIAGSSRDNAYLKARTTPPLNIPPGISSSTIHEEYPVSDRNYPGSDKKVSLVPPELYSNS
jgi:uncharacterized lipoprotein